LNLGGEEGLRDGKVEEEMGGDGDSLGLWVMREWVS